MKRKMLAGTTSVMLPIFISDTSSTTGGGLASLVYNSSGLTAKYRRQGESSWTSITLATATLGTFTSGGFIADNAGVAGTYEFGVPDAAVASGTRWVAIHLYGATNMLPVLIEIELDAINYQDSVRAGLTSLPNAAAETSGGLITRGSSAGQLNVSNGKAPATIAAGDIANAAITAAVIATDAIDADAIAADAVTELQSGLATDSALTTATSGLSTLTASGVWAYATRTLTSGGGSGGITIAEAQQAAEDALAAYGAATSSEVSAIATIVAAENPDSFDGGTVTLQRGATADATITGLTIPGSWTAARFTVKRAKSNYDNDAIVQILVSNPGSGSDGLVILNGTRNGLTASDALLTVNQVGGSVALHIEDAAMVQIEQGSYWYDVKFYYGSSDSVATAPQTLVVSDIVTETV